MPQRIISLVPSQTELLHHLGLREEVVGITKFCVHPKEWFKQKPKIGGTKTLNFDKIAALKPDLIIGNKEENTKEGIETLREKYRVWISDIITFDDALEAILDIGKMVGKEQEASHLVLEIQTEFAQLPPISLKKPRVAYLIWQKPFMVAANGTFIHSMLEKAGFENCFSHVERYPEVTMEAIIAQKPDCIFLSSEPYPFKQKHLELFSAECPFSQVHIVDGELFSWYGSRLLESAAYFRQLQTEIA